MTNIYQVIQQELTPNQQAAAIDPANEILTLACAGSGKSRTLAYRIARLLAEGNPPNSIVAFTFTEKAAESIKRRVATALQTAGLDTNQMGAMYIGTIHAYCQRILGEMDAIYRQYDVLDDNGLKLYLISRYSHLGIHGLRNLSRGNKYFEAINDAANAWKTANDELLNYQQIFSESPDVGNFLLQLNASLRQDQFIDFSLMIRNVVEALQSSDETALEAISNLKHLMVDEYQDVNPCQEELIRLLHENSETLFVVGDDDQSIYAWRGADVSNIIEFDQRYPNGTIHTLSQNFRSTAPIVEASDQFVAAELGANRMPKNPVAANDKNPQDFKVVWFDDRDDEAEWVAERIQSLLGTAYEESDGTVRGLTPADFAILMRSTRQNEQAGMPRHTPFSQALSNRNIPISLESGGGAFDRPQVEVLRSTFELLRNSSPDRNTVHVHFNSVVLPAYPNANFNSLARVLSEWGRKIHRPVGSSRIKLYPQQLVYDLLEAFGTAQSGFSDEIMRDIGLFSEMILDVETVYMSVDSSDRFSQILNFLGNVAQKGYDVSTDDLLHRPNAVTISTVHKMKGLEFPCVFVVDAEAQRFPKKRGKYSGWLPDGAMSDAINRGAYQSTHEEETRLFYTAITRAERYLYVSGSQNLPGGKRANKPSAYSQHLLTHAAVTDDANNLPGGLQQTTPQQRIEDTDYPTSYSEIKYYLQCPKGYQFRQRFGFNPSVPEMFGYGKTVHTGIEKLHEQFRDYAPSPAEAAAIVEDAFHLKHVPQSRNPDTNPGAYENAKDRAIEITQEYVRNFSDDFEQERQVEAVFDIAADNCVITGAIDLLLKEDGQGRILDAKIIDFKTMEGGESPEDNPDLDWTDLSLQVQLYAIAADQILGENARTGCVHLLRDNQRVEVPITSQALDAALTNVEWAVNGILTGDYPMRTHPEKCAECDFGMLCSKTPEDFKNTNVPPALHLPSGQEQARAFSLYDPSM